MIGWAVQESGTIGRQDKQVKWQELVVLSELMSEKVDLKNSVAEWELLLLHVYEIKSITWMRIFKCDQDLVMLSK